MNKKVKKLLISMCKSMRKNCLQNMFTLQKNKKYFIKMWTRSNNTQDFHGYTHGFALKNYHCYLTILYTLSTEPITTITNNIIERI